MKCQYLKLEVKLQYFSLLPIGIITLQLTLQPFPKNVLKPCSHVTNFQVFPWGKGGLCLWNQMTHGNYVLIT